MKEIAALRPVGFTPLGPASGTSVFEARAPRPRCGRNRDGFEVYPDTAAGALRYQGWTSALARLREHCGVLGGDGVIGVRLAQQKLGRLVEFTASGTAVRADGEMHPALPFTAHVEAGEFAVLMAAGWVPAGVVVGPATVRGHLGRRLPQVDEQPEHTDTLAHAMVTARRAFHDDALRQSAEEVVVQDMSTWVGNEECGSGEHGTDVEARVLIVGTAIARFRLVSRPPMAIMPLHEGGTR
ncbi:heavy metal-binding domain-containing protein [Lentzea sp. HUAS TT2]|uniref:heavy metal-binding domain-containing protein n=1 Tax=Lentzea sp. HUAS TT2 TaxID=3447454 RepID=UPI003F71072E